MLVHLIYHECEATQVPSGSLIHASESAVLLLEEEHL